MHASEGEILHLYEMFENQIDQIIKEFLVIFLFFYA